MAGVSQQVMKVWTDSKKTPEQKTKEMERIKAEGKKWYEANCGPNAKDEDVETELASARWAKLAKKAAAKKKKDQDDDTELTTYIIRRRRTPRVVYVRHDEDEDTELKASSKCDTMH